MVLKFSCGDTMIILLQTLMNVLKELISVTNSATTLMAVIPATVLNLAMDYVVMM